MDSLQDLNPAQQDAARHIEGPLLILAGPGSGKTRVIVHRIAYLIEHERIDPRRIMAVTFTNKAAKALRDRVTALLGETAGALQLGTFHAICARMLRIEGEAAGIDRAFAIYDDAELAHSADVSAHDARLYGACVQRVLQSLPTSSVNRPDS